MSALTLQLLNRKPSKAHTKWKAQVEKVADRLLEAYGTPSLGNFRDPVREIFYIVLSAKTTESLYTIASRKLRRSFPKLRDIAEAPEIRIRSCVASAGLGNKRAPQLQAIAKRLLSDFGLQAAERLRRLPAEEAYSYLVSLPGVGPKSALCVMMYSLDFDVFPVDTHAQRVLTRLGVTRKKLKHYQAQAVLPAFVPSGRSKDLHVSLVLHGRQVCTAGSPRCEDCVIVDLCRMGLSRAVRRRGY